MCLELRMSTKSSCVYLIYSLKNGGRVVELTGRWVQYVKIFIFDQEGGRDEGTVAILFLLKLLKLFLLSKLKLRKN